MNEYYCPVPFFSLEINTNNTAKLCCVSSRKYKTDDSIIKFWLSDTMNDIRDHMLNGDGYLADCNVCQHRELQNQESKRIDELRKNPKYKTPISFPSHLMLKINTVCNLKCIMCGPKYSSKWNEDVSTFRQMRPGLIEEPVSKIPKDVLNNLLKTFFTATRTLSPKLLELYGGEPMLAKDFWEIIDKLNSKLVNQVAFKCNTNATIINDNLIRQLLMFKKCILNLSIDGTKDVFEFVRYPANWKKVKENILLLKRYQNQYPKKISCDIYFTTSSFSVVGLSDLIDFCNEYDFKYFLNIADFEPSGLNENIDGGHEQNNAGEIGFSHPAVLPDELQDIILNDLSHRLNNQDYEFIRGAFKNKNVINDGLKRKFSLYCDLIKNTRDVDFKAIVKRKYNYDI